MKMTSSNISNVSEIGALTVELCPESITEVEKFVRNMSDIALLSEVPLPCNLAVILSAGALMASV